MAKPVTHRSSRRWPSFVFALLLVGGGVTWAYGEEASGMAEVGTAYGAKNACSCRYLAGRELGSCSDDFLPGMEAVFLSEDEEEQAVTAYVPLIASNTARYHQGFGCMLDPWKE
jgi:hypothetical protein